MHLRAGHVIAHVAEVECVDLQLLARLGNVARLRPAHVVVADRVELVAGREGADDVGALAVRRHVPVLVQVLHRVEVAERLPHRAGVEARPVGPLADHPVLDRVAVLVADHGHVVVAVG
jgi:hypothetical protein